MVAASLTDHFFLYIFLSPAKTFDIFKDLTFQKAPSRAMEDITQLFSHVVFLLVKSAMISVGLVPH